MECGCDNDSEEFNPQCVIYNYNSRRQRLKEAQELAEAHASLAVNVGARVPWVIRQVAGRGALTLLNK